MPSKLHKVAEVSELGNGQMKEVEVEGKKILLARFNDRFYAMGGQCPHYGASLAGGVLCGDRVVCPWHKAVFRVTDGTLLEPPALDSLTRYPVSADGNDLFLELPDSPAPPQSSVAEGGTDDRVFVLLGAGAAGAVAAEKLRDLGFQGRIVMISGERELPYDRTKLSKEFLSGNAAANELALRPPEFWQRHRVDRLSQSVSELKTAAHQLILSDGSTLTYHRLLLAAGSVPKKLTVPGSELGNIFTLRSQADAQQILDASQPGVRTVVVGGSFISMEVASCLALRKLPVTVVVADSAPFAKQLGPEVGGILQKWHQGKGVVFRLNSQVQRFEGTGMVRYAVLQSGEKLPADLVIVGTGVRPATDFVADLPKREDGGILADSHLKAADDVYVAGDLAVFPESYSGLAARIEHWRVAGQQGRVAAGNMLGRNQPFVGVPYFWTNHFGTRFDYLGHADQWDELILQEGKEFPAFIAFYIKQDRIVAASACQQDREIAALHELWRLQRLPSPAQVRAHVDLVSLAQSAGDTQREA